jgi:brefeldin A-resistance guanine nucleotide exchange factor 1
VETLELSMVSDEDPQSISDSSGSDEGLVKTANGKKSVAIMGPDDDSQSTEKAKGRSSLTNGHSAKGSSSLSGSLLIQPNNVCKVIKGEIHNVLNVMRTDARYVSPLRFMEELPSDEHHPLLTQLRDLHKNLSEWELSHHDKQPEAKMYLPPFCAAIQGRDISASVTGAALHAIHKFLLYGFLAAEGPGPYTNIAKTLLNCTFEESASTEEGGPAPTTPNNHDDEQVVLKLLDLSALVVRSSSLELHPDIIVGLLDTCLHVSHRAKRASSLLKSAASDALGHIVLEVFSQPDLMKARVAILTKLASLLNPQKNSESYVVNSLTLVNIALETMNGDLSESEINILQNDLCKFLLNWSATHDLVILSLTMRVIFNLFQTIRNHLKIPLEVFLTSVHLRILEHSSSHEEREIALESLLEFCQEPALIKDLYLNYDCDVNCTNLYASIVTTLGNSASPGSFASRRVAVELDNTLSPPMNGVKGGLAQKAAFAAAEVPVNTLHALSLEGLLTIIESIARRCKSSQSTSNPNNPDSFTASDDMDDMSGQMTEEELQERKREKAALLKVAKVFNKGSTKEFLQAGKDLNMLNGSPESVANFLYKAPGLDKDKLGAFLGKGPAEAHPFEHKVRLYFVKHFDFTKETSFAKNLRLFLHKFRLPGEAQMIDRFMEAFSEEVYSQNAGVGVAGFQNADAVFVLAFSTIMLNTDLHNPRNTGRRMTCEQFIRNNRGINGGGDLPADLLIKLYNDIRENELQVERGVGDLMTVADAEDAESFRAAWQDLLARKDVAEAAFTTAEDARKTMFKAGVNEKDMLIIIARPALKALSSVFIRSWDDGFVLEALKGFEQLCRISTYFGLDKILNDVLSFLLTQGREFITGCISLEYAGIESGAPISQNPDDDETMSIVDTESPIPSALFKVRDFGAVNPKKVDLAGTAAYRGLLALNMGLRIVRTQFPRVKTAWPNVVGVLASLRDARALPPSLADLDDFADSDGNVLPLSPFAEDSQKKLDEYYKGSSAKEGEEEQQGWFRLPLFTAQPGENGKKPAPERMKQNTGGRTNISANAKILRQVAERNEIEKMMVFGPNEKLPIVKQSIKGMLDSIGKFPPPGHPTYEQHSTFALELAVRALLANRDRAVEIFPLFFAKFQAIASKINMQTDVRGPFLIERIAVTILRSVIHLYSVAPVSLRVETFRIAQENAMSDLYELFYSPAASEAQGFSKTFASVPNRLFYWQNCRPNGLWPGNHSSINVLPI